MKAIKNGDINDKWRRLAEHWVCYKCDGKLEKKTRFLVIDYRFCPRCDLYFKDYGTGGDAHFI